MSLATLTAGPQVGDKVLTIRQPWAHLILAGLKTVENRSWRTNFRGRLWIHAAARLDCRTWNDVYGVEFAVPFDYELELADVLLPALSTLPLGAVVGSVEVYDCQDVDDLPADFDDGGFGGGPYCFLLRDPRPLATPIRKSGALNLWTWK